MELLYLYREGHPALSNPTFLIVDHEPTIRTLLRRIIGYSYPMAQVDGAADVAAARRQIEARPPTIVIAAFFLPDGTALDLLTLAHGMHPAPAVFITAPNSEVAAAAIAAGASGFLQQPFDVAQLLKHLTEQLARTAKE